MINVTYLEKLASMLKDDIRKDVTTKEQIDTILGVFLNTVPSTWTNADTVEDLCTWLAEVRLEEL